MIYIGHNNVKTRIYQHLSVVRKPLETVAIFDTFSDHFTTHFIGRDEITVGQNWPLNSVESLWQGNSIGFTKTFTKRTCVLCMRDRGREREREASYMIIIKKMKASPITQDLKFMADASTKQSSIGCKAPYTPAPFMDD